MMLWYWIWSEAALALALETYHGWRDEEGALA